MRRLPCALALLLIGCEKAPEPAATPDAAGERVSGATSGGASGAKTGATSDETGKKPRLEPRASASVSMPPPEPASREERARVGGNTRGFVECGDSSCTPGKQACAGMSEWQCIAADAVPSAAEVRYYCDDGTDCPTGETCCLGFETAVEAYVCSKRRGPETNCRLEICADGGARCPKGQVCREGMCTSPDRAATCQQSRCPKERPVCLWSERRTACGTWNEFETAQSQEETAALRCTRRSDCGPEAECCTNSLWTSTQCITNCDTANEGKVCTSDADCTTFAGRKRAGKCISVRDGDIRSLPEWLRVCSYEP